MAEVFNIDLLSRKDKAVVRRGAVFVAELPPGYVSFTYFDGVLVIAGPNVPPMVFNEETKQFDTLDIGGVDAGER